MLGPGFPGLQHSPGRGGRDGAGIADLGTESSPPHSQIRYVRTNVPRRARNKNQTAKRCCMDGSSMLNDGNVTMMESILSP